MAMPAILAPAESGALDAAQREYDAAIDACRAANERLRIARRRLTESLARQRRITGRQREVLDLVNTGMENKEIARLLGISTRTVKFHVSNLLYAFGTPNRARLIDAARR
jgi:DNA-binding NarL/FixJ family response regulator